MRVALISHEGGGISSVSHGLAQALSRKQIAATIFSGTTEAANVKRLNKYLEIVHLPILDLPPRSLWFQLRNFRVLLRLLKDYTVLHGVSPEASMIFTFFRRKLGKPLVTTIHGSARTFQQVFIRSPFSCWTWADFGDHVLEFPLRDFVTKRCLINSDHAVVCSFTTFNELMTYKNVDITNVSVVYSGIDFDEIESVRISRENNESDLSIIYAGRLFWTKGVMFLLRAFELLRMNFRDVNLNIFGRGPLERRIKRFILDAGLNDNVHFRGHIPRKDLLMEVKKSDVAVLPSLYEGQPIFALEAMACKKPLILFDVPFAQELVSNFENGVLAKAYDVRDLCDKIQLLLLDRKLRSKLGQNAYSHVKQKHNWEIQVKKYLKIYQDVTRTHGQRRSTLQEAF